MKFATIFKEDAEFLARCILAYPDIETGGDIFGFWNNLGLPVIQYIIGPGQNANHRVTFFNQDIDYLTKSSDAAYQKFGMQHIGSWHSHHKLGLAVPSSHDCQTMVNAIRSSGLSQFFMILGNIKNGLVTTRGFIFDKLRYNRYDETEWRILNEKNPFTVIINREVSRQVSAPQRFPTTVNNKNYSRQYPSVSPNYQEKKDEKNNSENSKLVKPVLPVNDKNVYTPNVLDKNK